MTAAPLPPDPAHEIDPHQAARLAAEGHVVLVDVREAHEWDEVRIAGALHHPLSGFDATAVGAGRPVVALCRSGFRSAKATQLLRAAGVRVHNLAGGLTAWQEAGLPVLTGAEPAP